MSFDHGQQLPDPLVPPAVGSGLMTATRFCLLVGLVLGIVAAFGGFVAFLVVLLFGIIGLVVGRVLDGKLDLAALLGRSGGR